MNQRHYALLATRLHPEVLAELDRRQDKKPQACNWPWGAVSPTAGRPNAEWCDRRLDHKGRHKTSEQYAAHKAGSNERQGRHRASG